jgi:photosystem II stability/assembly factor-like uncharacterized protein
MPSSGPGLPLLPSGALGGVGGPGAVTWQQMNVPGGIFLRAISMATPQVGYACGELGIVLKTTDGGLNWQYVLNQGFPYYWYGCQALDASTVVVSGFQNQSGEGVLRWSTTGGASWDPVIALTGQASGIKWLDRIEFVDPDHGIVEASWGGGVHRTSTGGKTPADWTYSQISPNWFQGTFTYLADQRVWIAGYDAAFSWDAGASWTSFPGTSAIFDGAISVHQNGNGFSGGGSISPTVAGWVYRTQNGANSWTPAPVLNTPYPIRALLAFDADRAWAVGGNYFSSVGGIWSTTNGGTQWVLEQATGNEMNDIDWVRVDSSTVNLFVAGYLSQIWRATLVAPANGGLLASAYGFCDPPSAPCGNSYNSAGCKSSSGAGAVLSASGTSSVLADDLVLEAFQLPLNKSGLVFVGPAQQKIAFGGGLLCVAAGSSGIARFPLQSSGAGGTFSQGPGIVAHASSSFPAASHIQPGQTWNFQAWYRDPTGPCAATNTSNAMAVTFVP